ncbi:hypothetical protein ACHAXM_005611 [Skeletonema potamos]|jgi:hypothetical protein
MVKSNKRRRIAADASSQRTTTTTTCPLYDILPGGILKEVASFLAAPSRVLFAVAITPPSSPYDKIMARYRPKVSRSSIAGNGWHTLDFGEIEKNLAAKLSDDDINEVLLHIDAANKVKRLRLTNCINITGAGLISLRGSTSIEQIDLSLVAVHHSPILDPEPPNLYDQVLPILGSIISQARCSLKHLEFPHAWRNKKPTDPRFIEILDQYTEMFENRADGCGKCNRSLNRLGLMHASGFQCRYDTCCVCTTSYCYDCRDEDGNSLLHFCETCERVYCKECAAMVECRDCDAFLCVDCVPYTNCASPNCTRVVCKGCILNECLHCNKKWCYSCRDCLECYQCDKGCCVECSKKEGVNGVYCCDGGDCYDKQLCDECRMDECQKGENNCKSCLNMIAPLLLEEYKKARDLKDEVRDLKDEIKSLKDKNKFLEGVNEMLLEKVAR